MRDISKGKNHTPVAGPYTENHKHTYKEGKFVNVNREVGLKKFHSEQGSQGLHVDQGHIRLSPGRVEHDGGTMSHDTNKRLKHLGSFSHLEF